ncbi:Fucose 4-O-acetylase [Lachnospiraceae bacterium XBD2001]|nr:Fucose 4-O-acetylase [Lachnospiraceae bacterium XBD2001]
MGASTTDRTQWIDVAKCCAIFAVLIDHTYNYLYHDERVRFVTSFSIGLFILTMGITSYWSYQRYEGSILRKLWKNCWRILRPYIFATLCMGVLYDKGFFLSENIYRLLHFTAMGPFYYVCLYLQLLLVAPLIFYFLNQGKRGGVAVEAVGLLIVVVFSICTTKRSDILGLYGGGGKLFGGTYLILFYLGMCLGKHQAAFLVKKWMARLLFIALVVATMAWVVFYTRNQLQMDQVFPFGYGYNPPGVTVMIYVVLIACTLYYLEYAIGDNALLKRIFGGISKLGHHTLYIFLYHGLFLNYIFPYIGRYYVVPESHIWLKRAVWLTTIVVGSIIIEYVFNWVYAFIYKAYQPKTNK